MQACVVLDTRQRTDDQLRSSFQRRQSTVEAHYRFVAKKLRGRHAIRYGVLRQEALAETYFQRTATRDSHRVIAGARQVREEFAHLGRCAQILLVGINARTGVVRQLPPFMNADARLVGLKVIRGEEPHVVRGHQRCRHFTHQFQRGIDERFFLRAPGPLNF